MKNYFFVDSKNTDDTTHFDPDFFQNLIAGVGIGIRMSWMKNLAGGGGGGTSILDSRVKHRSSRNMIF